jgi:hypothetical protein
MGVMGFPTEFIALTKLLFNGAHARVHINGRSTDYFSVQQGVRQGCPLAPYLFLIVGEVLNQCLKDEMQRQRIQGLNLPGIAAQQTTLQYANDTSLFLRGEEQVVRNTIELLNTFSFGSRLLFNWNKSMAYHWDPGGRPRPSWTEQLPSQWAAENDLSKLLGTPFGLSITTEEVDEFLLARTNRKLQYWTTQRLNSTSRAVICNGILAATAMFFLAI